MEQDFSKFIHPQHIGIFSQVAQLYDCHILVRETGEASIAWIGREGYTGKRGDMKAKTAKRNIGPYQLKGLVCSPEIHAGAHDKLDKAKKEWQASRNIITVPSDGLGFSDRSPVRCGTPYILQNNRDHKHFGCVAWVEGGLVVPRYVHGDYDLYAIVPAGRPYDPESAAGGSHQHQMGSHSVPSTMGLQTRLTPAAGAKHNAAGLYTGGENQRFLTVDQVGPLSFRVASAINNRIAEVSGSYVGALMVNHGEQVNIGDISNESVLAFLARPHGMVFAQVLNGADEHRRFFANA